MNEVLRGQLQQYREAHIRQNNTDERVKRQLAAALVPLLQAFIEVDGGDLGGPEALRGEVVKATGFKGGNYSHGGELAIRFTVSGNDYTAIDYVAGSRDGVGITDASELENATLRARGDWEQAGLIGNLMDVLAEILPVYYPVEDDG
jgi:hypothetical protein